MFPNKIIPKPSIYQNITKKEKRKITKKERKKERRRRRRRRLKIGHLAWLGFQLKLHLVVFGKIIIQFHNKYSAKILYFNIIPAEMDRFDLNVLLSVLKAVC